MRRLAALLLGFGLACGNRADPGPAVAPEPPPTPTPAAVAESQALGARRPQPKPGERVRQPELDGYCTEPDRAEAFYYHGGSPVVRVAREHGCAPLYLTECEAEGRCYPPRDQEPGMWCCASPEKPATAHAAR
jgi:hypothetical protein